MFLPDEGGPVHHHPDGGRQRLITPRRKNLSSSPTEGRFPQAGKARPPRRGAAPLPTRPGGWPSGVLALGVVADAQERAGGREGLALGDLGPRPDLPPGVNVVKE